MFDEAGVERALIASAVLYLVGLRFLDKTRVANG